MKNIFHIILIAVALGLGYLYLQPKWLEVKGHWMENRRYQEVLAKSDELRGLREDLRERLDSFRPADLAKLEKMIPAEVDQIQLILELDGLALRRGLAVKNFRTTAAGEAAGRRGQTADGLPAYKTVAVSFSFESSYENFLAFLKDLESSLRLLDLHSVQVRVRPDRPLQEYSLTLNSYWLK